MKYQILFSGTNKKKKITMSSAEIFTKRAKRYGIQKSLDTSNTNNSKFLIIQMILADTCIHFNLRFFKDSIIQTKCTGPLDFELPRIQCIWSLYLAIVIFVISILFIWFVFFFVLYHKIL